MKLIPALGIIALASCQTVLAPIDKAPLKVRISDVSTGSGIYTGNLHPGPGSLFVTIDFSINDTREIIVEEMSYIVSVNGKDVGHARFKQPMAFFQGHSLELIVRNVTQADDAVKAWKSNHQVQLRGVLRYQMVNGGRFEHAYASEAAVPSIP